MPVSKLKAIVHPSKRLIIEGLAKRTIRFVSLFNSITTSTEYINFRSDYYPLLTKFWFVVFHEVLSFKDFLQVFLSPTRVCIKRNCDSEDFHSCFFVQDWQIRLHYHLIQDSYLYCPFGCWILVDRTESGFARWFIQSIQCIYISETDTKSKKGSTGEKVLIPVAVKWISHEYQNQYWRFSEVIHTMSYRPFINLWSIAVGINYPIEKRLVIHQFWLKFDRTDASLRC